jgi:LssY C-terminus
MDGSPVRHRGMVATTAMVVAAIAFAAGTVLFLTHVASPRLFSHYDHNPALAAVPKRTRTRRGREADPVNLALVGTAGEIAAAFGKAGWTRADSLSRASDIAIAESVILHRPDSTAPVSSLFLFGRRQDIAYEREVGRSASRRHHVRLWMAEGVADSGRPTWIGDAAYDLRAGLSHRSLAPTHHIEADVDRERDTVLGDLAAAGQLSERYAVTGLGPRVDARNAEGDRFDTDGELDVGVVWPGNVSHGPITILPDPLGIRGKNAFFEWAHRVAHRIQDHP